MKKLILDVQKRLGDAILDPEAENAKKRAKRGILRPSGRLFEYVDIDWGQIDFYSSFPPPLKFPAALIDINSVLPSNKGNSEQILIVDLQVRVIDLILGNTSYRTKEEMRTAAFRILDLVDAVNALLHGWTASSSYGQLTKQGYVKVNRPDQLKEYRLTYRIQQTDNTAARIYETTPTKPKISLKLAPIG